MIDLVPPLVCMWYGGHLSMYRSNPCGYDMELNLFPLFLEEVCLPFPLGFIIEGTTIVPCCYLLRAPVACR